MSGELILNENANGLDILHRAQGLTEQCNSDDITGRTRVDLLTAQALVSSNRARYCEHCNPERAEST